MTRVRRQDTWTLDGSKKTREGYIDTFANLTRTGVFEYRREDGTIQRELRLPEHVFAPEAIASFDGQPLTLQHPRDVLDPSTYKRHAIGMVFGTHKADDGIHLRARVRVMDAAGITAVERGMREVSNGYETVLVPIVGGVFQRADMNEGKPIHADFIQTEIAGNHTALVPLGRAGPTARLDSAGNQGETMTEEEKKAFDAAIKAAKDAADALAAMKARADAAEGTLAGIKAEETLLAQVKAEKAKADLVAGIAPLVKKDAAELIKLDESAILTEALAVMSPELPVTGMSLDALRGAFHAVQAMRSRKDAATEIARALVTGKKDAEEIEPEDASQRAYEKARRDAADFWKQKAARA